jgi:hypothetical protein
MEQSRTARRRRAFIVFAIAGAVVSAGCYSLSSAITLMSSAPAFTGTGARALGGTIHYSVGLAGQDVHNFGNSTFVQTAPFLGLFGGPHRLTAYVQTVTAGFHQREFIHGNLVGHTDNLRLIYKEHPDNVPSWVEAFWPYVWDGGEYFRLKEICGLAASDSPIYANPDDPESHLFLSFRACGQSTGTCAAGVLEAWVDAQGSAWSVESGQDGTYATLRRPNGARFSDECMPISVTSDRDQAKQYLVVADPSMDEVSIFDAFRLYAGPLSSARWPDGSRNLRDVVIEGARRGSVDVAWVAVLWSGTGGTALRHHSVGNGIIDSVAFLNESPGDVSFIESDTPGPISSTARLFTYGAQVVRRTYVD